MHHFFAYMARMRYIDRWALMRNSYTENIQEHSHQVAILAHALAVLRNAYFGGQVDAGAVAVAALYHDASEILTGDLPTPIKYYNPDIRDAYKQVEGHRLPQARGHAPEKLRDLYADLLTPADPQVEELVKAADKLSAHIKCLEEEKAGNHGVLRRRPPDPPGPGGYAPAGGGPVLEEFLPSFRLTLDELGIMRGECL